MINRRSTAGFVPPSVYIGFPLFVLAKRRSEQLFTAVRLGARGAVGFQGHRNVGTLFCSASPRPAVRPATCRPDPPVVCPGFGLDRYGIRRAPNSSCPQMQNWVETSERQSPLPDSGSNCSRATASAAGRSPGALSVKAAPRLRPARRRRSAWLPC